MIFTKALLITFLSFINNDITITKANSTKFCRKDFSSNLCASEPEKYTCFKFKKQNTSYIKWNDITKDKDLSYILKKINRRDSLIFNNHCVAIPNDLNIDFNPLPKKIESLEKTIYVDLNKLAWGAYNNGELIYWGVGNGGAGKCKETGEYTCKTPIGKWKVYSIKKGFARSSLYPVECENKSKCGHPYFNVIKFGNNGEALHGENEGHVIGKNVSHGCVRIFKEDSKWLINFVEIGTSVVVTNY